MVLERVRVGLLCWGGCKGVVVTIGTSMRMLRVDELSHLETYQNGGMTRPSFQWKDVTLKNPKNQLSKVPIEALALYPLTEKRKKIGNKGDE